MKIFYLLCICAIFFACGNSKNEEEMLRKAKSEKKHDNGTELVLHPAIIDFGKVSKAKYPEYELNIGLENKGSKPLVINKTEVSCGCMRFDVKQKTILPGKKVMSSVIIKTEGVSGFFNKTVFIRSTANNSLEIIRVKGEFID